MVIPTTFSAPARISSWAADSIVAPVVYMSSARRIFFPLTDVPLLPVFSSDSFEIYVPYSNEDKVFINIFERPYIEAFQSNEISEQQSFGRTEMGFAVVIRAIPSDIISGKQKINNKKNGTNVILGNSIEITGDTIITGNLKITGDVTIKGKLKVSEIDTESGIKKGGVDYVHP